MACHFRFIRVFFGCSVPKIAHMHTYYYSRPTTTKKIDCQNAKSRLVKAYKAFAGDKEDGFTNITTKHLRNGKSMCVYWSGIILFWQHLFALFGGIHTIHILAIFSWNDEGLLNGLAMLNAKDTLRKRKKKTTRKPNSKQQQTNRTGQREREKKTKKNVNFIITIKTNDFISILPYGLPLFCGSCWGAECVCVPVYVCMLSIPKQQKNFLACEKQKQFSVYTFGTAIHTLQCVRLWPPRIHIDHRNVRWTEAVRIFRFLLIFRVFIHILNKNQKHFYTNPRMIGRKYTKFETHIQVQYRNIGNRKFPLNVWCFWDISNRSRTQSLCLAC